MKPLYRKPKDLLPGILLDRKSGKFIIFGISCPYDAFEFYDPVFKWFDEYLTKPLKSTVLDLKLTYFNTASAKFLLRIMTKLNKLSLSGHDVKIRWHYSEDDDDMKEEGEEFESILKVNFEFISMKEDTNEIENDDDFDFIDDIL